jgi:hypothetical protein
MAHRVIRCIATFWQLLGAKRLKAINNRNFCDPHHSRDVRASLVCTHEIPVMEASMTTTFTNPKPAGWSVIAARVAERQHTAPGDNNLTLLAERDFADVSFTRDEARAEALKWVWQH